MLWIMIIKMFNNIQLQSNSGKYLIFNLTAKWGYVCCEYICGVKKEVQIIIDSFKIANNVVKNI